MNRRGIILVIVLIVVAALSLAAYSFSALMVSQSEAVQLAGRRVQARMLAESGVEALRAFLLQDPATLAEAGGLYDNPERFQGIPVMQESEGDPLGRFTVLAPSLDAEGNAAGFRYGLEDESGRVNLNALLLIEEQAAKLGQENVARDLLMALPGMTLDIADAILDWLDDDDDPREFGAELEYYTALDPPYAPKNGPLETVEELLLVRDVLPQLLFGSDINRNGMLDPEEELLAAAAPDLPPRGWGSYLTLYSQEKNISREGLPRVDLNGDDLQALNDALTLIFPPEWVRFIIAYRQNGAYTGEEAGELLVEGQLDLTKEGKTKLSQVLDLVGKKVQVTFQGEQQPKVLQSPFGEELVAMALYLPELMDKVTIVPAETIPGRININQAPYDILIGIPGMTDEIVTQILDQRSPETADDPTRQHETWLLTEGLVTLDEMRALMPFVCAGGSVYRAQVVGYYDDGLASARLEAVLDATRQPPRLLLWRDISHLGRAFALETLGANLSEGL